MTGLPVRACALLVLAACAAPPASRTTAASPSIPTATSTAARPTPPPAPPTRDPHTPGYVQAAELPDGAVPSVDADGSFIIGATHDTAPEMRVHADVP